MIPMFMLILLATLLKSCIILAAPPIAQVVSTNNVLEGVANQADQDVNAVTAVNGLLKAQRVPEDLENLANDFNQFSTDDKGIAGTSDPGTEDTVTESFETLSDAIARLMDDLISKKNVLDLYGQMNATYTQLVALRGAYLNYAFVIAPLVQDSDHRTQINDETTEGLESIEEAEEEFEPSNTL
ncbi:hypothetical protein BDR22DRAFT_822542 [Usnea florida]